MWHAAPLTMQELATYSPSSMRIGQQCTMSNRRLQTLTNEDSPEVDKDEEGNICELLERKNEWEDVVWYTLREAIHGVEGMAGVRCGHNPLVMRFVQRLVNHGMMQTPVNPVDA